MMRINVESKVRSRATRYAALCLLALVAVMCQAPEARAQWATNGNHITNTNPGNVGVGTMNPAQIFHVHSPGTWAGTRVTTTATGATVSDGVNFGYDDAYGAYIWNREASPVIFSTSNTERMRVDAAGNVGIGTATPTASRLHVYSPGNTYLRIGAPLANQSSLAFSDDANGQDIVLYRPENTRDFSIWTATASNVVRVTQAGNVGIGVTAPSQALHVMGKGLVQNTGSASALIMDRTDGKIASFGSGGVSTTIAYDDTGIFKIESNTRATIALGGFGSGTNRFTIDSIGNVGVGTAAPQAKLHVTGDIRVDGNITAKYQDVAEWVPSTQALVAGTVVALDTSRANHVVASASAYDTRVAGVVSAQPGIALGERGEGKVLVATTGRVKIKVNAAHAPIRIGDLLVTSDVPGVAMKSEPVAMGGRQMHAPGTIIGKALESLEKGAGEILVLLSLQ